MRINEAFEILGVEKGSPKEAIDKAYKKGLAKNHPDRFSDEQEKIKAEAKFKQIQEAYTLIKDNPFGVSDGAAFSFNFKTGGFTTRFNPEGNPITFNDLFNLDKGSAFRRYTGGVRPREIHAITINISFEESMLGCVKEIEIQDKIKCNKCNGKRIIDDKPCEPCEGLGVEKILRKYQIKMNPGVCSGETLSIAGATLNNVKNLVRIIVEPHSELRRSEGGQGNDVLSDLEITLLEALKGTSKSVKTIKGDVLLKIPEGIKHSQELRIKGYGVLGKGDHLVNIKVDYPEDKDGLIEFLER